MSAQFNDLARQPEEQRQQWDSVADGWKKWWRTIENGAQFVSMRLLELAEVEPGQRVLDIATGIGEPALLAASRVGSSGSVVATDLSSRMLAIARERAAAAGLTNVEFIEADADRLNFPDHRFDTILCRWGLPSLPHPLSTLAAIRRMLTTNGSFATSVWEAGPKGRPLASLATAVAREMFEPTSPRAEAPPPASGADTIAKEMTQAGFTAVRSEEMTLILEFPSAEDSTQYLRDVSPDLAVMLSERSSGEQAEYWQRLAARVRQYAMIDGSVRIPNVTICAVGRR